MTCLDARQPLQQAVRSVLAQPECLELLIADMGASDGSMESLQAMARYDPRIRILQVSYREPARALNSLFYASRGTFIGYLNVNDHYPPGALARAVSVLSSNPDWLMVYGEAEIYNDQTGSKQRYPTLPASVGVSAFRSHCFICQSTVVYRRSMGILLGEYDERLQITFDLDYWLRAFNSFSHRIGYIPYLQAHTCTLIDVDYYHMLACRAIEATQLLANHFGIGDACWLHNYALELQYRNALLPEKYSIEGHLTELLEQISSYISADSFIRFKTQWIDSSSSNVLENKVCNWKELPQNAVNSLIAQFNERPFGVNLIGHAFEIFGIGEDLRMAAGALQAANIPFTVVYYPANNGASCSDRTLEQYICKDPNEAPYAFNLVCMAAPIQARWLNQNGCGALMNRYTISSWPWETKTWPKSWYPLFDVADELWPSSNFTASALVDHAMERNLPLRVMPMASEIPAIDGFCNPKVRTSTRDLYGLPQDNVVFCFGFDLNSTAIRKNPMAVLEVFQSAFPLHQHPSTFGQENDYNPLSDKVSLMIKTFKPRHFSAEWNWLQARASEDPRVILIADSLPRNQLLSLYASCDVFLSLHRSEGFGRGLAEALQLGLDVIATDFGGNTDFCKGPLAHPVRWHSVEVPRGAYPCADGHFWAEPNLHHAVEVCRKVASKRLLSSTNSSLFCSSDYKNVLTEYRKQFSFDAVGARYRSRLEALWSSRLAIASQLRWRTR